MVTPPGTRDHARRPQVAGGTIPVATQFREGAKANAKWAGTLQGYRPILPCSPREALDRLVRDDGDREGKPSQNWLRNFQTSAVIQVLDWPRSLGYASCPPSKVTHFTG